MPTWLVIILVVAAIGGIIGYFAGDKNDKGSSAVTGAVGGAMGCGYLLLQIFLFGLTISLGPRHFCVFIQVLFLK